RLRPRHDHRHRPRDLEGEPRARHRARPGADRDRHCDQRRGLGPAARRRTIRGMTEMRAPLTELPIVLEDASVLAGGLALLDRVSLLLAPGAPTRLVGPNGSRQPTHLRL